MQNSNARQEFENRCLSFGVAVLKLTEQLPKNPRGKHVADQLVRSGTSIGANLQEAQAAQSRADFIHKMQLALKEARETTYWLNVVQLSGWLSEPSLAGLVDESQQIGAILGKSVVTAKRNGMQRVSA